MSDTLPEFPQHEPPATRPQGHNFVTRDQVKPLFKIMKHVMKNGLKALPNQKKVLQRRNRTVRKKFRVI